MCGFDHIYMLKMCFIPIVYMCVWQEVRVNFCLTISAGHMLVCVCVRVYIRAQFLSLRNEQNDLFTKASGEKK